MTPFVCSPEPKEIWGGIWGDDLFPGEHGTLGEHRGRAGLTGSESLFARLLFLTPGTICFVVQRRALCRQVKHLNFYDIVLDFILMDSFEDLESPPISIQNVINNRWLNSSFKETVRRSRTLNKSEG